MNLTPKYIASNVRFTSCLPFWWIYYVYVFSFFSLFAISFMRCAFFSSFLNKSKLYRMLPFELLMFAVSYVIFQKKGNKKKLWKIPSLYLFCFRIWLDDSYNAVCSWWNDSTRRLNVCHMPPYECVWEDTLSLDIIVPLNMHLWWNSRQTWTVTNNADEKDTNMQTISWEIY